MFHDKYLEADIIRARLKLDIIRMVSRSRYSKMEIE